MKFVHKFLNLMIVGLVLIIGLGFYFFKNQTSPIVSLEAPIQTNSKQDDLINKHLKQVSFASLKQKLEMDKTIIDTKKNVDQVVRDQLKKTDLERLQIPPERQIHKDLPSENQAGALVQQPEELVEPEWTAEQKMYKGLTKAEYAAQFIENARKAGYEIELSDDMQVLRSTPIRSPSQESSPKGPE